MSSLTTFLWARKYPQSLWSRQIADLIRDLDIGGAFDTVYDAPGGVGFVSYNLSREFDKRYYVMDIDEWKLNEGRRVFGSDSICFQDADIYSVEFAPRSLWLLINSLFLLDDLDSVMVRNRDRVEYIVGVFPYLNSNNYRHFKSHIDANLNSNEMSREQTVRYFNGAGYQLVRARDTTNFPYLKVGHLPIVSRVCALLFTLLERVFNLNGKLYWIGVFKRADA